MESSLLSQGLNLMLYGMGVVFLFLAVLVVVTTAMSAVIDKYFPEKSPLPSAMPGSSAPSVARPAAPAFEPGLIRAIEMAIVQHREKRRR